VRAFNPNITAIDCDTVSFFRQIKLALIFIVNAALRIVGHTCDNPHLMTPLNQTLC